MSTEAEVGVLVNSVMHYFETAVQQPAACGIPHLALRRGPELSDYTGILRISGRRDGVVFFTAPRSMLCVPVISRSALHGVIQLMNRLDGQAFG